MPITSKLKVKNDSELLSYMINISPELREEIDLPVQGQSLVPIGKLILSNERYKIRSTFLRSHRHGNNGRYLYSLHSRNRQYISKRI